MLGGGSEWQHFRLLRCDMSRNSTFRRHILPMVATERTLDLGCGPGEYLKFCAHGSVGVDLAPGLLKLARGRSGNGVLADLNRDLPVRDSTFARVLCVHTLEHVDAPISLLRTCHRILSTGGKLILALPLERWVLEMVDPYYGAHPYHLYSFTKRNITHLLRRTGFSVDAIHYDVPRQLDAIEPILDIVPRWIRRTLGYSYWIIANREGGNAAIEAEELMGNAELERRWLSSLSAQRK
jgi:SAM-dependent methyltransferase